jgi:acyl CoA:acetate/3-ketoacid CoA transferase beta subunit
MMAVAAAREIRDGDIVFCGTGISMLAAMAAKHISAPNSVIFLKPAPSIPSWKRCPWPWAIPGDVRHLG